MHEVFKMASREHHQLAIYVEADGGGEKDQNGIVIVESL